MATMRLMLSALIPGVEVEGPSAAGAAEAAGEAEAAGADGAEKDAQGLAGTVELLLDTAGESLESLAQFQRKRPQRPDFMRRFHIVHGTMHGMLLMLFVLFPALPAEEMRDILRNAQQIMTSGMSLKKAHVTQPTMPNIDLIRPNKRLIAIGANMAKNTMLVVRWKTLLAMRLTGAGTGLLAGAGVPATAAAAVAAVACGVGVGAVSEVVLEVVAVMKTLRDFRPSSWATRRASRQSASLRMAIVSFSSSWKDRAKPPPESPLEATPRAARVSSS